VVEHSNITWVTFVLCVVVSLGLLIREKDEETLTYLDALPVSRREVFLAKWIMALVSINVLNLLWFGEALLYDYFSRTSDAPELSWRSVGMVMFLAFFSAAVGAALLVAERHWSHGLVVCLRGVFNSPRGLIKDIETVPGILVR